MCDRSPVDDKKMDLLSSCWMLIDIILISIGLLTSLYIFIKYKYSYWERKGFKTYHEFNYLFGHFTSIFTQKQSAGSLFVKLYNSTSEPYIGIYGCFRQFLLVRDLELIRSVLIKDFTHFTDRNAPSNPDFDPLTGNLFALPGHLWKLLRSRLSPAFTSGKLTAMFPTLVECGTTIQCYLNKLADNQEIFDVKDITERIMCNLTASIAFGLDIDTLADPQNNFRKYSRKIFEKNPRNILKDNIRKLMPHFVMRWFRIKAFDECVETFFRSIVKQNLEYREQNNVIRKDFFQILIQLRKTGIVHDDEQSNSMIKSDENQHTMTLDKLTAQTFVFFTAGFETTARTMSLFLYEMAKNPRHQRKVHDEIDRILAANNGQITYESMSQMKYLENCILEILRLHPVIPFLSRTCVKDYQIPETNKVIEKGVVLFIPVHAIQSDATYYKEPHKFNPDRFNEPNSVRKNTLDRPFLSFGNGPRNCIGMRLGKMQAKFGLVMMLKNFRYELIDREINFISKGVTLTASDIRTINLRILNRN